MCSSSARPEGLAAALGAARAGAEVTLLERFGCFGGNLTAVGVEGLAWYRHEQTVEAGGIGPRYEDRAVRMGAAVPDSQSLSHEIDAEGFKLVADALVREAGVHPMLHRLFVTPLMDGGTVRGVVVESKAGREAVLADRVIDATGDADVAHRAGAPTVKTPPEEMQAASIMFHLSGVDKQAFLEGVRTNPPSACAELVPSGEWTVQTSGKEDELFSPFLRRPFAQAIRDGIIPADLSTIAGTWGAMHDTGRAHLHEHRPPRRVRRHRPGQPHTRRDRGGTAGRPPWPSRRCAATRPAAPARGSATSA